MELVKDIVRALVLCWAFVVFLILAVATPLCFFAVHLMNARRKGVQEYGLVASRYVSEFHGKWIEGKTAKGEPLVGSADIQSLADLFTSFEIARQMRPVPVSWSATMQLMIILAVPFLPLTLTMFSLDQLIDRALKLLF